MSEVEKLEEFIYVALREIEIEFDTKITEKALITDKLSQKLNIAGYLPVELAQIEVLGDEKIMRAICSNPIPEDRDLFRPMDVGRAISQATIVHNEAKGQLYRVKPA